MSSTVIKDSLLCHTRFGVRLELGTGKEKRKLSTLFSVRVECGWKIKLTVRMSLHSYIKCITGRDKLEFHFIGAIGLHAKLSAKVISINRSQSKISVSIQR